MASFGYGCDFSVTPEDMSVARGQSMARDWATQFKHVFFGHKNTNPNDVIEGGSIGSQHEIHHNSLPYRKKSHPVAPHGGAAYANGRDSSMSSRKPKGPYRPMYHSGVPPLSCSHQLQAYIVDPGQRMAGVDTHGSSYPPGARHAVLPHTSEFLGIDRGEHGRLAPNGSEPRDSAPCLGMPPAVMMPPIADAYHMGPQTPYPRPAMSSRLGINKTSVQVYPEYRMHQRDFLPTPNAESYVGKRQDCVEVPAPGMSFVGNTGEQYVHSPCIPSFGDVHAQGRSLTALDSGLLHSRSPPSANIPNTSGVGGWNYVPGPEHHYKL